MTLIGQSVSSGDANVECVRLKLRDWPLEDRLTSAYTAEGGVLAVSDGTQWGIGDELEVDDANQSVYLVRSISSNNVTVKVRHRGSTEASHASGAVVRKRPRFTRQEIEDAISHAVGGLAPEVYDVTNTTITYSSSANYYAAPADFIWPISAIQKGTESTNVSYGRFSFVGSPRGGYPIEVIRDLPVADFASGIALYIPYWFNTTNTLLLTYARKVTTSTISTGLMADTVCWGAVDHLLSSAMVERSAPAFSGNPEAISSVDSLRASLQADRHYRIGKQRLMTELRNTYPISPSWRW